MREEAFYYGESNRGFGMVTLPENPDSAPVAVLFNAGLVHREGPYRLNVLIARALAEIGIISIRVDLSGKGDTPSREGLINRESVALDWSFIKKSIAARFGQRNLLLIGLCSGADNAIKITAEEDNVRGLVLMDPVSPKDADFKKRLLIAKLTNPYKWLNLPHSLATRFRRAVGIEKDPLLEATMLRDEPTLHDLQSCMKRIVSCNGKVLAVFTGQASYHYNTQGQFVRALNIEGFNDNCCEEVYWPHVNHIYQVQTHRERLVQKISSWAAENLRCLQL
jgi:hypothetical protein